MPDVERIENAVEHPEEGNADVVQIAIHNRLISPEGDRKQ
jgi:hypothetical protein